MLEQDRTIYGVHDHTMGAGEGMFSYQEKRGSFDE